MTTLDDKPTGEDKKEGGHGGHGWMMMICCIPMLVIAVALVITGVASAGLILAAVLCTAMMWLMMRGMSAGPRD